MNTVTTQNTREYRDVPVTTLTESSSNPRKRFDETSLNELAATFKTQGVLAPLLVRKTGESRYEVIAGFQPALAKARRTSMGA
jgi:ParB family transcriptional regulator, chromosome partitioning protein